MTPPSRFFPPETTNGSPGVSINASRSLRRCSRAQSGFWSSTREPLGNHDIKKLTSVAQGEGKWRTALGRFRSRYDIYNQQVVLHYCGLRRGYVLIGLRGTHGGCDGEEAVLGWRSGLGLAGTFEWSAPTKAQLAFRDALVGPGFSPHSKSWTRGSSADEGVRPTVTAVTSSKYCLFPH